MTGKVLSGLFLGSKAYGLAIFDALHKTGGGIDWRIVTLDDDDDPRSARAGFDSYAAAQGLPIDHVGSASKANALIAEHDPDVVFVCGWYWILPPSVLGQVPLGCFGVHNSLLPRYRGWAPLVWAMINGDKTVGATVFKFGAGMDDGPYLFQARVDVGDCDTVFDVTHRLEREVVAGLGAAWPRYLRGEVGLTEQDQDQATYCGRRIPDDGLIDWAQSARRVHDFVRAQVPPYPGAFSWTADRQKVIFGRTEIATGIYHGTPGQILEVHDDYVRVSCGGGTSLKVFSLVVDGVETSPRRLLGRLTERLVLPGSNS